MDCTDLPCNEKVSFVTTLAPFFLIKVVDDHLLLCIGDLKFEPRQSFNGAMDVLKDQECSFIFSQSPDGIDATGYTVKRS